MASEKAKINQVIKLVVKDKDGVIKSEKTVSARRGFKTETELIKDYKEVS